MSDDTITITRETAETALNELEVLINETGGGDIGADEACTPLALTRQKVEAANFHPVVEANIIEILHEVSEERGVEISDADPLVDSTFRAEQELRATLYPDEDEEVDAPYDFIDVDLPKQRDTSFDLDAEEMVEELQDDDDTDKVAKEDSGPFQPLRDFLNNL